MLAKADREVEEAMLCKDALSYKLTNSSGNLWLADSSFGDTMREAGVAEAALLEVENQNLELHMQIESITVAKAL